MNLIEELPPELHDMLHGVVEHSKECLGNNLVGVYLHGSLPMGCFNEKSSDIDVLIVVNGVMTLEDKQCAGNSFIELINKHPANKLELSIVTLDALQNFQYPTPYELHFSNENVDDFANDGFDLMKYREDADLAAHVVITKNRGLCLYGEAIESVFPNVAGEYYLKSIAQDFDWSFNNVMRGTDDGTCRVPTYAVLNSCRVLAFIKDKEVCSKCEGGIWAIAHLPQEYGSLIQEALNEYAQSGSSKEVDAKLLKQFMKHVKQKISHALTELDQTDEPPLNLLV